MASPLLLLVPLILSFLSTFCVMPWLLRLCSQRGFYDLPDERKVHTARIPRLGGLLFAPSMVVAMSASILLQQLLTPGEDNIHIRFSTTVIAGGLLTNYLVGILDDIFGVRARIKFGVQVASSLLFPLCGLYINNLYGLFGIGEIPFWVGYPLTVLACLLVVNAYNLIDGIDGLAASLAVMALAVLAFVFWQQQVWAYCFLALSLIGSLLAFLYFNLWGNPARGTKTFMGDTGSLVIGYSLAYLGLKCSMHNPHLFAYRPEALLLVFSLFSLPIFDLVRVALTRSAHGLPMFRPDRSHLHHLCLDAGFSMHQSLLLLLALQGVLIGIGHFAFLALPSFPSLAVVVQVLLFLGFVRWIQQRAKQHAA